MKKFVALTMTMFLFVSIGLYSCSDSSDEAVPENAKEFQLKRSSSLEVSFESIWTIPSFGDVETAGAAIQAAAIRELYDKLSDFPDATDIYIGVKVGDGKQIIADIAFYDSVNDRTVGFFTVDEGTGEYQPNSNEQGPILDAQYFGSPCGPGLTNLGLCPLGNNQAYCIGFLEGNYAQTTSGGFIPGTNYTFTINTGTLGSTICGGVSM